MDILLSVVVIVSLLGAIAYSNVKSHKKLIRKILSDKGATGIDVKWEWAWGDRSNSLYTVDYTNRQGQRRQTTCKVGGFSEDVYWSEPPEVYSTLGLSF